MSEVILAPTPKLKAREIVVAPRLPSMREARETYKSPFDAEGDIVVDCDLCGYHAMGPRRQVGAALREHHRLFHPNQTGVVLLNQPRQ
jgi:hypothetical protein